jgi:chemosensory pili system protein ChpA (sensor histidine kinase/response regulator)
MKLLEIPEQIVDELDEEILEIFVEEVQEVLEEIINNFAIWQENPEDKEALQTLRRAFHTLKGSGRLVGALVIGELGWKFENMLNRVIDGTMPASESVFDLIRQVQEIIPSLITGFQQKQPATIKVRLLISQTHHLTETKGESLGEFDLPAELSKSADLEEITEDSEEKIDANLLEIFSIEAQQHIAALRQALENYANLEPEQRLLNDEFVRRFHTLNGSSRSVHFAELFSLASPAESYSRTKAERQLALSDADIDLFTQVIDLFEQVLSGDSIDMDNHAKIAAELRATEAKLPPAPSVEKKKSYIPVDVDEEENLFTPPDPTDEFMTIFLEEAEEILENTQSLLEKWQSAPDNMQLMKELQRELHTLKGGARMVEITPMGDLSHHLESVLTKIVEGNSQSSSRVQEVVQVCVDELVAMLESVKSSLPLAMPNELIKKISNVLSGAPNIESEEEITPPPKLVKSHTEEAAYREKEIEKEKEPEMTESGSDDRIRVRVALIEKLTGLAGELSISRAHMEQQQGSFKTNLAEMEQTVTRLRDQLRRLEIETEAQILSSFRDIVQQDDEEFDPLELDRFSVMQQLSRSLAESVNDLLNIQDFLKVLTRQSDILLVQQTRIGTELQDVIMRTRMIPFSRISPRLQRIARLTGRELRKQIEFEIIGENIEFERTVLNRIVAPLEHMLRNAIGHGVEDKAIRLQAGKPPIALIKINLSKEGTDLIIRLSDDGSGLNLSAIRKKAEERGMIKPGHVISDKELMQFILEPSFSTAQTVTQLSGRGVGMDVVNTEIKQLGGSLQIFSRAGHGTIFEIRLPLSLTINQALLVHVHEETMAVPLNHIEAVLRIPHQQHLNSETPVYHKYMDFDYRIFYLGDILGFAKTISVENALVPALLIRSGDKRVALLVDGIEGSKEVVVKPIGPQIGSIKWLAGATILGDGRVVLILDVPALTRVEAAPQYQIEEEIIETAPVTIMVVDDSITVRKVTARLLKRQGMEVLTAKDGVDAVAQLQEHIPDLMLLDVEMPRMDGYELATQIRNTPELKHIPIIMITSRTGAKHRDRAEKIGINRYLGKPFNETELLENINALLNERQIETAN